MKIIASEQIRNEMANLCWDINEMEATMEGQTFEVLEVREYYLYGILDGIEVVDFADGTVKYLDF